ncbi:MAG TPA: DUF2189 domain-containing protein [Magnetospirillum sp.]|nr:DUF2189 domain-containing protein [Magnetospirillum sp.]
MQTAFLFHDARGAAPRPITLDHPWRWLASGWLDMCSEPAVSYVYGAVFAGLGFILLFGLNMMDMAWLILPLGLGFALVGPAAAVGLYEVSRRLGSGDEVDFAHALGAFRRNPGQIALVGLFLLIAFIAWVRLAMLEFMLFFGAAPPGLDQVAQTMMSSAGVPMLLVGAATGAVLAACVFAMTAIAIPMLVDRPECDAVTAMMTSVEVVCRNPRPMALWAFLIGLVTVVGAGLFFVGLVVALPLLGHASWHAYRDLIGKSA